MCKHALKKKNLFRNLKQMYTIPQEPDDEGHKRSKFPANNKLGDFGGGLKAQANTKVVP